MTTNLLNDSASSNAALQPSTHTESPHAVNDSSQKHYNIYYTTSRLNARLHLGQASTPCIYYMESKLFNPSGPRLFLRDGSSKTSPMVAFVHGGIYSTTLHIGSGDYHQTFSPDHKQDELRRDKGWLQRSDWHLGTSLRGPERRVFCWRRDMQNWSQCVVRCEDEEGNVVASMLSGGMFNFKKGGEIMVVQGLEKKLEELILMSALAIWGWEGVARGTYRRGYPSGRQYEEAAGHSDGALQEEHGAVPLSAYSTAIAH